ncbi:hypothetical protein SMACR_08916 [Sordaria macrospora]|uniref:WGS project CABT00000000 data, contig 2.69 n=2 Tax=Sordaria macrospora TaxID=5147 RepID=F7WB35_SORMK|nr:uncharacterized protein SMAC_08916 [Sordaria macrospora k-hell]KAA8628591.1 hypothetical protein SMACR_08916 [Sordaria macrospora]KAH7635555.1 hypothetical protein B0T09DRAFT_405569 [Sordaria sp. MPI-SDFR-AT-0083]WPJ64035.1 hypothetical protein SMAC4_08916 [Sordaria macrospora]CCC14327.1 unnamed protein product [Sordaria macrospora k-hell]
MQFLVLSAIISFLVTTTAIFSASASLIPEDVPPPGLVILKRTAIPSNGTLAWYGQALNAITTIYQNTTTGVDDDDDDDVNIFSAGCSKSNDNLEPT